MCVCLCGVCIYGCGWVGVYISTGQYLFVELSSCVSENVCVLFL